MASFNMPLVHDVDATYGLTRRWIVPFQLQLILLPESLIESLELSDGYLSAQRSPHVPLLSIESVAIFYRRFCSGLLLVLVGDQRSHVGAAVAHTHRTATLLLQNALDALLA